MDSLSEDRQELIRECTDFIAPDHGQGEYMKELEDKVLSEDNIKSNKLRLVIKVQDIQNYRTALHRRLLTDPESVIRALEIGVENAVRNNLPKTLQEGQSIKIGLTGELGPHTVSPRELSSAFISRLVRVEGIVTKCSLVRPKVIRSVHYCEETGEFQSKEYRDVSSTSGEPTGAVYPQRDDKGNPLTTELGLCKYKDHQHLVVQELPETAPAGQLPRSVEIMLEDDLVDSCKPGGRISADGIYKAIPPRASGQIAGVFKAVLVANSVCQLSREVDKDLSPDDFKNAAALAKEPDVLSQLAKSLAPSIYGHDHIKKGLILLLLGGRERNLANGHHLRGDINCLLVGDPGVAKSQLLRAVMNVAELSVSTTGRGSSGVGLTAAITVDGETGDKQLEAGAMVLADRGVVCIDEFDKMNDIDRVAIHEVMEQQTVTIAKAGIQVQLNARCSVVAAANPLYGNYDHDMSVHKNVNLPDSLLSRFDMLFIVLDNMTNARDKRIADHVLGQHMYRAPGEDGRSTKTDAQERMDMDLEDDDDDENDQQASDSKKGMYVKYDRKLHGPKRPGQKDPLSVTFLKKFIRIAKKKTENMEMTPEAMEAIQELYGELRQEADNLSLPITVRSLETIIRLSTAAAVARMSDEGVQQVDVEVARGILTRVHNSGEQADEDEEAQERAEARNLDQASDEEGSSPRARTMGRKGGRRRGKGTRYPSKAAAQDDEATQMSEDEAAPDQGAELAADGDADMMDADDATVPAAVATAGPSSSGPSSTPSGELNNAQKGQLYQVLRALFLERGVSSVQLAEVVQAYNEKSRQQCTAEAVDQVLNQLAQDFDAGNKSAAIPIMYNDEVAYLMENA